jgi:tryptophan 2,3-dioxygenase
MKRVTYWEYIAVEELLSLQGGTSGDEARVSNDELLFIVSHQIFELWFKLVLRELTAARDFFKLNPVPDQHLASAVRALRRVTTVLSQAIAHFEVVETLTTRDCRAFRDSLVPASGFQSAQLREIEIVLGLDQRERIPLGREGDYLAALKDGDRASSASRRVEARLADGPSLKDVLDEWLFRTPIDGSLQGDEGDDVRVECFLQKFLASHRAEAELRLSHADQQALTVEDIARLRARYAAEIEQAEAFLLGRDEPAVPDEERRRRSRIRAALVFIESYRELPLLAWPREVVDTVVELEQRFVIFRQRHARMVERVIGRRTGTGGSAGVDYLDQTALRYRIFRNFWAVRTLLVREAALPALEHADTYGFKFV